MHNFPYAEYRLFCKRVAKDVQKPTFISSPSHFLSKWTARQATAKSSGNHHKNYQPARRLMIKPAGIGLFSQTTLPGGGGRNMVYAMQWSEPAQENKCRIENNNHLLWRDPVLTFSILLFFFFYYYKYLEGSSYGRLFAEGSIIIPFPYASCIGKCPAPVAWSEPSKQMGYMWYKLRLKLIHLRLDVYVWNFCVLSKF